jgi:hypothetical protein
MVGSQAVHATTNDVPDDVLISRECDVLLDDHDPFVPMIDEQLGRDARRGCSLIHERSTQRDGVQQACRYGSLTACSLS